MFHYYRPPSNPQFILSPHDAPVAEFLYQLTKMLTDNNSSIIEWTNGRIVVHDPPRLATDVLSKYFRHSKFSSFQRQLNYFGFRKLAGKGKMSPCSYVNDATTMDIRSLMTIKRKTCRSNNIVPTSSSSNSLPNTSTSTTSSSKRKVEESFQTNNNQQFQEITSSNKKQKKVTIVTVPSMVSSSSIPATNTSSTVVSDSSISSSSSSSTMNKDNSANIISYPITVSTCGMMYDCRCPTPCTPSLSLSSNTSTNTVTTASTLPQQQQNNNKQFTTTNPLLQLQQASQLQQQLLMTNNNIIDNNNISEFDFDAAGFCNALNDAIRTFNNPAPNNNEFIASTTSTTPDIENTNDETEDQSSILNFLNQHPSLNTTPIPQPPFTTTPTPTPPIIDNTNGNSYSWLLEPTPISEMYLNIS